MFQRARRRLTILYIILIALVLGIFSVVFYVAFRAVLGPAFDIAPDLSTAQAAEAAYHQALERVAIALVLANVLMVGLVGTAAWVLANRTLRPIRDAHERQRRFVADASHEMRTPLAAIRATAESSLEPSAPPDTIRPNIATILDSAERLSRITNDLLLLARTDDRTLNRSLEPFDLSVAVAEATAAFQIAHPGSRPQRTSLSADLQVEGVPADIERIVTNLLDNAFRYGGPSVAVGVTTSASERDATVEVTDDGPGIAPSDLAKIFEPFHRLRADAQHPEGSGLGLAIARSLAERAGGRLGVTSELGHGTTFRLVLPRLQ